MSSIWRLLRANYNLTWQDNVKMPQVKISLADRLVVAADTV